LSVANVGVFSTVTVHASGLFNAKLVAYVPPDATVGSDSFRVRTILGVVQRRAGGAGGDDHGEVVLVEAAGDGQCRCGDRPVDRRWGRA
jgi:hypothetical protein